jgi:hypothetical protein
MQLFDLQSDPGEQADVADEHPEEVRRLKAAYDAIHRDLSADDAVERAPLKN